MSSSPAPDSLISSFPCENKKVPDHEDNTNLSLTPNPLQMEKKAKWEAQHKDWHAFLEKAEKTLVCVAELSGIKTNFPKMKADFDRIVALGVEKQKDYEDIKKSIASLSEYLPEHDRMLTRLYMDHHELQCQLLQIHSDQLKFEESSRVININERNLKRKYNELCAELNEDATRLATTHDLQQFAMIICKKQRIREKVYIKEKEALLQTSSHFTCFLCSSNTITHTTNCCSHAVCNHCFTQWLKNHSTCPFCRKETTAFGARSIVF